MIDRNINQRTILSRVLVGAFIGAVMSAGTWAVILFLGIQNAANSLESTDNNSNAFLLDVTFAPSKYLVIFGAVGILFGVAAGAALSARAIKFRQTQTAVSRSSSKDTWPPSPTA